MNMRLHVIPASYVLYQLHGKLLFGLRKNTGYDDGNYSLPAGHLEPHEGPLEAARREFFEETGLDVLADSLDLVHVCFRKLHHQSERIDFFYLCTKDYGAPRLQEPDKCDHWRFFELENLPKNINRPVMEALKAIDRGIFYQELEI